MDVEVPLSRGSFGSDGFETEFDLLGVSTCKCVLTGVLEFMPTKILQHSSANRGAARGKEIQEGIID